MVKITQELLSELELFDSATVQNAGVIIKGYTKASNDYTNPDISRQVKIKNCRVGIAHTSSWTPITPPKKDPANKNAFYDSIQKKYAEKTLRQSKKLPSSYSLSDSLLST